MESAGNSSETPPDSGCKRVKKTRCEDEGTDGIVASMRRLKIQEHLLETAVKSAIDDQDLKEFLHTVAAKRNRECVEIKNTFHVLKSLLNRFKYNVSSPDCLRKMEIKEYKQMVLELDKKIIYFKRFLAKELNVLRRTENALMVEIKEAECEMSEVNGKLIAKPYSAIVPSSVKAIRNTPSACPEVQKFQEFINRTGGHRGGWGEQEHALFLSCRRHCACGAAGTRADGAWLDRMIDNLLEKIPGLAEEDVLNHEKWYGEYARLKAEQRAALERWRGRRQLAKQQFRSFELHLMKHPTATKNVRSAKPKAALQRALLEERKTNLGKIIESQEYDKTNPPNNITTERQLPTDSTSTSTNTECLCHSTKTTNTQTDDVIVVTNIPNEDIADCERIRTNSHDNEELNQKQVVQIKNVGNYLKPTKTWSIKTEKEDKGLAPNLHDNEQLNQKELVEIKNVGNYLKPTKKCSIKTEKDDKGLAANSQDNEELNQREVVEIKNLGKHTKTCSIKTDKDDKGLAGNSQDNEEFNQREVVEIKNVGNYLKPTKTWSIKTEKDDKGLAAKDFRLHIPMANAPKLGISNWRRCLVEERS